MLPVSGLSFFDCPFRYSLTFIYLVYPMLPVSLDCPFLIALSVFSNVYLSCVPYVASFSGLSFFDGHFRYSLTFIYLVYPMLPVSGLSFFDCPFRYSLTFIYLVYPMLPVSLDCPFLIATFGIL